MATLLLLPVAGLSIGNWLLQLLDLNIDKFITSDISIFCALQAAAFQLGCGMWRNCVDSSTIVCWCLWLLAAGHAMKPSIRGAPKRRQREKLVAAIVVQAEHNKIYELHLWAGSGSGSGSGSVSGIGTVPGLSNACCVIATIYQLLAANLAFDIKTRALTINT